MPAVGHPLAHEGTLGLRVPDHAAARELARALGGLMVATSANPGGLAEARTADEVLAALGSGIDMLLDGGTPCGGIASTVVRAGLEPGDLEVLREGALTAAALASALGRS